MQGALSISTSVLDASYANTIQKELMPPGVAVRSTVGLSWPVAVGSPASW